MTAHILAAGITPPPPERVAVLALVLVFLIVEIPWVISICRQASQVAGSKATNQ